MTFARHRNYSIVALFVTYSTWIPRRKCLVTSLLTTRWTFRLMVTNKSTLTITTGENWPPITMLIPGHSPFQTLPYLLFSLLRSAWRAFRPLLPMCLILRLHFKNQARPPAIACNLIFLELRCKRQDLLLFIELLNIVPIINFILARWNCSKKFDIFIKMRMKLQTFFFHT